MNHLLLGILMIGGFALYAAGGVLVSRKILHGKVQEGHNDVCVPIFLNAGVLFAVLLGFMVVAVWESFDLAKTTVATEATAIVLPAEASEKVRETAREYIHEVIEDEWPIQARTGGASSKARKQIGELFRCFGVNGAINAQTKKDFPMSCTTVMSCITEVTNDRNKRNLLANESIPTVMWCAIFGGALVIVTMSFIIYMERPLPHMLLSGLMAGLIGLLLFSCFVLSHPFQGPIAITPESFEKILVVLDDVDRGN